MSISIDAKSRRVIAKINNIDKTLPRNIRNGLYTIGGLLRSTASKNILKGGRNGRIYRVRGRNHKASSPGESWANISGEARRGIIYKVRGATELLFGNNVKHAKFLEFGTRKMKARPAHLIAIRQNSRNIIKIIEQKVQKAMV